MKTFSLTILIIVSLLFINTGLFSQEVYSTTGTQIFYTYSSPSDSVYKWKRLYTITDSNARYTVEQMYKWSIDSGLWVPWMRDSMITDWSGLHRSEYFREWDEEANQWGPEFWTDNTYLDSLSNITINQGSSWDSLQKKWVVKFREEYEYDDYHNNVLLRTCDWVSETEQWQCHVSGKQENQYDVNGFLAESTGFQWSGEDWQHIWRLEYSYDTAGRIILEIRYEWNSDLSVWVNDNMVENYYDSQSRDTLKQVFTWEGDPGDWRMYHISKNRFDILGRAASTISGHQWEPNTYWNYTEYRNYYNPHGKTYRTEVYRSVAANPDAFYLYETINRYYGAQDYTTYGSICQGDSILWRGDFYDETCVVSDSFRAVTNVDSVYTLHLVVDDRPGPFTITDLSGSWEYCEGETVWYSVPENDSLTYTWWSDHGEILSGQYNDTLVIQWTNSMGDPALYCQAGNSSGCVSDTVAAYVDLFICDGKKENPVASFSLYPVPAGDRLWLASDFQVGRMEIFDTKGVGVAYSRDTARGIDLSMLSSGIYLIRIFDNHGVLAGSRTFMKN